MRGSLLFVAVELASRECDYRCWLSIRDKRALYHMQYSAYTFFVTHDKVPWTIL
jgi:hypothetical protein